MTALEYMERQVVSNKLNHDRQIARGAPEEDLANIRKKIEYYTAAAEALREQELHEGSDFPFVSKSRYLRDTQRFWQEGFEAGRRDGSAEALRKECDGECPMKRST